MGEPEEKPSAPPRESIELRFLCLWEKADVESMPTEENTNRNLIKDTETLAKGEGQSTISTLSLLRELFTRLVIYLSFGLIGKNSSNGNKSNFSGNPEDYVDQFINVVESYPTWPSFAKSWVSGQMKNNGNVEEGIAKITKE